MRERRALIAMSGGVDSSIAAYLMQKEGYDCVGVTMKLFDKEEVNLSSTNSCCSMSDIEDARAVAERLGMPYYVTDFMDGFLENVILPFVRTYLEGATPNPCIFCNKNMKFGDLVRKADEYGCEKIVTGHYVRKEVDPETGICRLKKAADESKDQTYVLYFLSQEQLRRIEFPMGDMLKTEARALAEQLSFVNAEKADSQDICFVPDGNYKRVIEQNKDAVFCGYQLPGEGNFVDREGNILGKHKGFYYYTIGQRKGLGIAAKEPLYVLELDPVKNEVVLGRNEELFRREVHAVGFHFNDPRYELEKKLSVQAKIRYRHKEQPGTLVVHKDGSADMIFDEPQRAVTRGQSLVVYDGEYCIGGGIIAAL